MAAWLQNHRWIVAGFLVLVAGVLLVEVLVSAQVFSSWGVVWGWLGRWWFGLLAIPLVLLAAVISWRGLFSSAARGGSSTRMEVLVAMIAALAVLVSGGVSAFTSWLTTTRTLDHQRIQGREEYLLDNRKTLYFDVLQKKEALSASVDKTVEDLVEFQDGKLPIVPYEDFKDKRDIYQYTIQPMIALAPTDTSSKAAQLAVYATTHLDNLIELNLNMRDPLADHTAIRTEVDNLLNRMTSDTGGCLALDLVILMRRDLGVPEEPNRCGE